MLKNKYSEKDLNVHTYGRGRNKKFIAYTDFNKKINKWNKTVYPDIEGNKVKAIKQVLAWLNAENSSRFAIFKKETKITIAYDGPSTYCVTDGDGRPLY